MSTRIYRHKPTTKTIGLILLAELFFLAAFPLIYPWLAGPAGLLVIVPVGIAGWLFGWKAAAIAGLINFPINLLLLFALSPAPLDQLILQTSFSNLVTTLLGIVAGWIGDIQDQLRQRTAALRASEQRLETVLDNILDSILVIDISGKITMVNTAVADMFYTTEKALIDQPVTMLLPRSQWESFSAELQDLLQQSPPALVKFDKQYTGKRTDGVEMPIQITFALATANERPLYTIIIRDMSEPMAAAQQLADSERYHRSLINHSFEGIHVLDEERTIRYASPSVFNISGYQAHELLGRSHDDLFTSPSPETEEKEWARLLKTRAVPLKFEKQLRHKDGRLIWIEAAVTNLLDDQIVNGIIYNYRDITSRKQEEEEREKLLSLQQQRTSELSALLNSTQTMARTIALEQVTRIFTEQICTLLQADSCTLYARNPVEETLSVWANHARKQSLQPQRRHASAAIPIANYPIRQQVLQTRQLAQFLADQDEHIPETEQNLMAAAGVNSLLLLPLGVQNDVIGLIEILDSRRDRPYDNNEITLARTFAAHGGLAISNARLFGEVRAHATTLEKRIRARTATLMETNEQLDAAVKTRDQFLATISHELRTPLNAILAFSEGLLEGIYGSLTTRQTERLQRVYQSGQHLLLLINDILDTAKFEAGNIHLDIDQVSINHICQETMQLIEPLAKNKSLKLHYYEKLDSDLIHADGHRLKQILINLLNNAVKFTPEGGQIGLQVVSNRLRKEVQFEVWDTGIGIDTRYQEQLFQPFVQLDSSLTRNYEGTGLGLSLVRRLVELHGGTVVVSSRVGAGSRFIVSLPRQEDDERSPQFTSSIAPRGD